MTQVKEEGRKQNIVYLTLQLERFLVYRQDEHTTSISTFHVHFQCYYSCRVAVSVWSVGPPSTSLEAVNPNLKSTYRQSLVNLTGVYNLHIHVVLTGKRSVPVRLAICQHAIDSTLFQIRAPGLPVRTAAQTQSKTEETQTRSELDVKNIEIIGQCTVWGSSQEFKSTQGRQKGGKTKQKLTKRKLKQSETRGISPRQSFLTILTLYDSFHYTKTTNPHTQTHEYTNT